MNKKEQQAQRAKQEDVVLNKVLWWIVGAVVLEALLLLLNKVYANYTVEQIELAKSLRDVFSVLMIALPICFVVLLIWAVAARKSGKFTRLSSVLAGVMLALAVCAVVIRVFDESGIRLPLLFGDRVPVHIAALRPGPPIVPGRARSSRPGRPPPPDDLPGRRASRTALIHVS